MTKTSQNHKRTPGRDKPLVPNLPKNGLTARIVGGGGTGSIVARHLSTFLSSLPGDAERRVVLIDGDVFERKNASRMLFSSEGNKAEVIRADLLEHFADSKLTLLAIDEFVTPENITRLLPGGVGEYVILSVDNHATRKLVSDYCEGKNNWPGLHDICVISGGNDPVGRDSSGRLLRGSYGNCMVYLRRDGTDITPSLTRYHAEIDHPADRLPTDVSCVDSFESVPQLLFANLMTASAICNTFWLCLCDALHYGELAFDIVEGQMRPAGIGQPVCSVVKRERDYRSKPPPNPPRKCSSNEIGSRTT